MATYSSIPAWKIPRAEEPAGLQSMGPQRVGHDQTHTHAHTHTHTHTHIHTQTVLKVVLHKEGTRVATNGWRLRVRKVNFGFSFFTVYTSICCKRLINGTVSSYFQT